MTQCSRVQIHYRRPPDRLKIYDQRVVHERDDVIVTLSEPIDIPEPMTVDGRVMLEPGSLAVWFTFPELWHDIGRFHRADGTFSGIYANVLTPPTMSGSVWHTTDLFLDVWWPSDGPPTLLDEDEFHDAVAREYLDRVTAERALQEAERLMAQASAGTWPPSIVEEWPLARTLERVTEI